MSKYGYSIYGGAKYGLTPKLAYSVEPMDINVIKFDEVFVSWQLPTGTFTRFRVVRNQNGYPETSEDGVIVYELNSADGSSLEGSLSKSEIYDGLENPTQTEIVQGRNIFYRVFLYTADNVWVRAGQIREIVPEDTGTTKRVLNLLPRVVTTPELSPLGVVDEDSALYKFLDGVSFSYEQMLTEIKLSRPSKSLETSNFSTIPGEVLNLGLNPEPNLPVLRQRALIREAISLYANKGTQIGIAAYAEALTGFAPTVTVSNNLMLTVQDSTFYQSTGRWVATNAAITSTDEMIPDLTSDNLIDKVYTLKIVATDAGSITLGEDNPLTQGIPFKQTKDYKFSYKVKSPASDGFVKLTYNTYDRDGEPVIQNSYSDGVNANNTWQEDSTTFVVPTTGLSETTFYATLTIDWDSAGTYYIDQVFMGEGVDAVYDEARVTTVELAPFYTNYIPNPSFEVDDSNWTLTGLTFTQDTDVPAIGYPGSSSGKFVAAGNWSLVCDSQIPVEKGVYFTVSHYLKSPDMSSMDFFLDLYDSDDQLVETLSGEHTLSTDWTRDTETVLIPYTSTATYAISRHEGTAGTFYLDMVMAQNTYVPTDYIDGSMPELTGVIWEGTANASASLYYPNKSTKLLRLAQTMVDWMPMNSWWKITTPAGLEYTNLDV